MKEFTISENEQGSRLDKQLLKILKNSGSGFIYKMLRKKNITLNGLKACGNEHLKEGDIIRIYFSDETFEKLSGGIKAETSRPDFKFDAAALIIYENDDLIILDKPAGLLSQKAADDDISVNELCIKYLIDKKELTDDKLIVYRPSVCNRLDRNTSGLMIFSKNYSASREISHLLKERTLHKYYKCLVKGCIDKPGRIEGYLKKDEKFNKVTVLKTECPGASRIVTEYVPLCTSDDLTLLEIKLITGKSHQIRAHLSSIGHPIIGDTKYGDRRLNGIYKDKYGINRQMLHSYKLEMPKELDGNLKRIAGMTFEAKLPDDFMKLMNDSF